MKEIYQLIQTVPGIRELALEAICLLQQRVDGQQRLLSILFPFDRLYRTARLGRQRQIELGVLAEAARVAKVRILPHISIHQDNDKSIIRSLNSFKQLQTATNSYKQL